MRMHHTVSEESWNKRRGSVRRAILNEYKEYFIPKAKEDAKDKLSQTWRLRLRGRYPNWKMKERPLSNVGWGDLVTQHIRLQNQLK
jgi:hypothetical protein